MCQNNRAIQTRHNYPRWRGTGSFESENKRFYFFLSDANTFFKKDFRRTFVAIVIFSGLTAFISKSGDLL